MFVSFHEANTCERQTWNTVTSDLRHVSYMYVHLGGPVTL